MIIPSTSTRQPAPTAVCRRRPTNESSGRDADNKLEQYPNLQQLLLLLLFLLLIFLKLDRRYKAVVYETTTRAAYTNITMR